MGPLDMLRVPFIPLSIVSRKKVLVINEITLFVGAIIAIIEMIDGGVPIMLFASLGVGQGLLLQLLLLRL